MSAVKHAAGSLLRRWTSPLVAGRPIEQCPGWLGTLHNIKVPGNIAPNPVESTAGSANIRIIFRLLESTLGLGGDVAECGVWQGSTLIPTGLFLRRHAPAKTLFGFDSFEGLNDTVARDVVLGGEEDERKQVGGFSNTSLDNVQRQVLRFGLDRTVRLVPGYFQNTLPRFGGEQFCFVHLDCVIYESYRTCLEFFYPRMVRGGVILLDEYNDPPWPGCTMAVDEFLAGKREELREVKSENHVRYYFQKL
jgi:hypothetical protein